MTETQKKSTEDFAKNQKDLHSGDDLDDVNKKNERIQILRKFTADDKILNEIDRVAFEQKELEDLVHKGEKKVYLCGESFVIPGDRRNVTYIGVNDPVITFKRGIKIAAGTDIQGVRINIESMIIDGSFGANFSANRKLYVKILHKADEQGYIGAKRILGNCYSHGFGVEKNNKEAAKWYRKAAELGDEDAQISLGDFYDVGIGVEKNDKEASEWYRKAAEQGNGYAQIVLGNCYADGLGVKQDYKKAIKWYKKAASAYLPRLHLSDVGLQICKEAAEQGDAEAQFIVGAIYLCAGEAKKAVKWHRKAAKQGDKDAQVSLGNCYARGCGVAGNKKEAVKWYMRAAEQGSMEAQYKLGDCYATGSGVAQDWDEAMRLYKVAEHGAVLVRRMESYFRHPRYMVDSTIENIMTIIFIIVFAMYVFIYTPVFLVMKLMEKIGIKKRSEDPSGPGFSYGYMAFIENKERLIFRRKMKRYGYKSYPKKYESYWREHVKNVKFLDGVWKDKN